MKDNPAFVRVIFESRAAYSDGWVNRWDSNTSTPDPWEIDGADDRIYLRDFDLGRYRRTWSSPPR